MKKTASKRTSKTPSLKSHSAIPAPNLDTSPTHSLPAPQSLPATKQNTNNSAGDYNAELHMLSEHIDKISQHLTILTQQLDDIEKTSAALRELFSLTPGTTMLVPVVDGVFIEATLQQCSTLLVNIGCQTVVPRTIDGVLEMIDNRRQLISSNIIKAQELLEQFESEALRLYSRSISSQNIGQPR